MAWDGRVFFFSGRLALDLCAFLLTLITLMQDFTLMLFPPVALVEATFLHKLTCS